MSRSRRSWSRVAVIGALLGLSTVGGAAWAAMGSVYKDVGGVAPGHVAWMHAGPGLSYQHVGYLQANATHVRTTNCGHLATDNWCQVHYRGTRGWVQDRFLRANTIMRS